MNKIPMKLPRHPVWPTVLILCAGAVIGAIIGGLVTLMGSTFAVAATGPLGWLIFGPIALALYTVSVSWALIGVPLWALFGGQLFAGMSSGKRGSAARNMKVTFFSETHPISQATRRLTDLMGVPPVAYIGWFPNEEINAFAMGTNSGNSLIAVSKGAVERLTKKELLAVIGHELGHVASQDMARMTFARGVQNALTFFLIFRGLKRLARWVFTPLSELEILRMSRAREFTADKISAIVLGPEAMISVLQKLEGEKVKPKTRGYANAMMWSGFVRRSWLSTHPPLDARIAALKAFQSEIEQMQTLPEPIAAE
jgi:heat shock protein HtpX